MMSHRDHFNLFGRELVNEAEGKFSEHVAMDSRLHLGPGGRGCADARHGNIEIVEK